MRKYSVIILAAVFTLCGETLFEVKDASNNKVLDISTDGLRVLNGGDTLMVISTNEIKANLSSSKGLSRSFSVTTTSSVKDNDLKNSGTDLMRLTSDSTRFWISDTGSGFGVASQAAAGKSVATDFLKVTNAKTQMREGEQGGRYTDFSPDNIFLGLHAGEHTVPWTQEPTYMGSWNTFIGNYAGYSNTNGFGNIYIGYEAGYYPTGSNQNTYIGYDAGYNFGGQSNTIIGYNAAKSNGGSGDYNSIFGRAAGFSLDGAASNTLIGGLAGSGLTDGFGNTLIGKDAGKGQTGAAFSYNTVLGYASGTQLTTGGYNVIIGYNAGSSLASGTGNIFIGKQAGGQETGSYKLYIDNSNSTTPLIWGDFANDLLRFYGNVGIGIAPSTAYGISIDENIVGGHFQGRSTSTYSRGVRGYASGGTDTNYGVYGYATGTGATNYAGYFNGDINVTGSVVKAVDEVKIDHPIDPENKSLSQVSITSDQMTNIYHGNVILDSNGKAVVMLPDWIGAINKDFRYQLTAIGAPGPNLYISKKLKGNSFEISGGSSGMEVSWQLTGIRNDKYAQKNPIQVEKEKKAYEKGFFLHPDAYGLTEEKGIEYQIQKHEAAEIDK